MSSRKDDVWEITSTICGSSQARADYARNFKSIFLIPPGPFTNPSKFREKSKFVASFIIWKPHWIDEETFLHLFHLKPKPKRPRVRRRWVNNPTLMRLPVPRGSPVPQWWPTSGTVVLPVPRYPIHYSTPARAPNQATTRKWRGACVWCGLYKATQAINIAWG